MYIFYTSIVIKTKWNYIVHLGFEIFMKIAIREIVGTYLKICLSEYSQLKHEVCYDRVMQLKSFQLHFFILFANLAGMVVP